MSARISYFYSFGATRAINGGTGYFALAANAISVPSSVLLLIFAAIIFLISILKSDQQPSAHLKGTL